MAMADSKAPVRLVKRVQFGILSPDEIVSVFTKEKIIFHDSIFILGALYLYNGLD